MTPAYDRELIAEMLEELAPDDSSSYAMSAILEQIRLLREADNAEAASVGTVAASEDGLPELPKPAMQARAMRNVVTDYDDLVADPTGDCVVFADDALYTAEQMRAYGEQCRRLATPEQPGSAVQGEAKPIAWIEQSVHDDLIADKPWTAGANNVFCQRKVGEYTVPLYTTPPPAPAAEQEK